MGDLLSCSWAEGRPPLGLSVSTPAISTAQTQPGKAAAGSVYCAYFPHPLGLGSTTLSGTPRRPGRRDLGDFSPTQYRSSFKGWHVTTLGIWLGLARRIAWEEQRRGVCSGAGRSIGSEPLVHSRRPPALLMA